MVKGKIKGVLTNDQTVKQNYFSVCDLIKNWGFGSCQELQYWAVADMTNGEENKVASFTLARLIIEGVANGNIIENQLGDYVSDPYYSSKPTVTTGTLCPAWGCDAVPGGFIPPGFVDKEVGLFFTDIVQSLLGFAINNLDSQTGHLIDKEFIGGDFIRLDLDILRSLVNEVEDFSPRGMFLFAYP